ncbi:MAG TPA: hypothetical protein VJP80_07345 [Candidatus Saccharimonadales bacterium]|nr:hypothetical protein [Candidatus Saccharimonadales bacterium]
MIKRASIVSLVTDEFSQRFRVIDNTGTDKKVVAGQFPDIILMRREPPPNNDILFVMRIENGGELVDSVPVWRALATVPSVLYIITPESKLDEAKKLASAVGVRARFASYTADKGGNAEAIRYE